MATKKMVKKVAGKKPNPDASEVPFEDLDPKLKKQIGPLVQRVLSLKAAEDEAKAKRNELNVDLEIAYKSHHIKSVIYNGHLVVLVENEGRKIFNPKMAMELLAKKGVDLKVIQKAFDSATCKGDPYSFMQIRKVGEREEE